MKKSENGIKAQKSIFQRLKTGTGSRGSARKDEGQPTLSVVVVVYNIAREAARTLYSLSAAYQRHIDPDDYEVIVVDNGSKPRFDPKVIKKLSGNFRMIRIDDAAPSPAKAVNRGLAEARGEVIGVMVDGARIVTPGLLHYAYHGTRLYENAVVATLGWYLGFDFQRWSVYLGYDQEQEDALLAQIEWPQDGYRLFEIATLDESSVEGWFQPISESNSLFMRRELWDSLGGVDERFDVPGGGLINLDTFHRALELPRAQLVRLLGEGTFHQLHGGVATNLPPELLTETFNQWDAQYEKIRGHRFQYQPQAKPFTFFGVLPPPALAHFARAAIAPVLEPPLGADFDIQSWSDRPPARSADPTIAALVELAQQEFNCRRYPAALSLARLIRSRAPDEAASQRMISLIATSLDRGPLLGADYHVALGKAYQLLDENEPAASHYREALTFDGNLREAHMGLATLRMPGESYLVLLERLYGLLAPETVIEIGVYKGESLALVQPPAVAIGIDPSPTAVVPLQTETHIFAETSDEFFDERRPEKLLAGRPLSIGFIDGLHLFEQALKDFMHLEMYCGPRSVILLHDTVPLDEATQSRTCDTMFHTGDIWKMVLCLKHYRPDLDIFTIATPPSGLTVVTGLDPTSRVLTDRYDEAVEQFIHTPYSDIENRLDEAMNIVPNEWDIVDARLRARQAPETTGRG